MKFTVQSDTSVHLLRGSSAFTDMIFFHYFHSIILFFLNSFSHSQFYDEYQKIMDERCASSVLCQNIWCFFNHFLLFGMQLNSLFLSLFFFLSLSLLIFMSNQTLFDSISNHSSPPRHCIFHDNRTFKT